MGSWDCVTGVFKRGDDVRRKCIMMFSSRLWNDRAREDYDNTTSVVANVVAVFGFVVSIACMPSLKVAVFIWGCTCIIDDFGWLVVYSKVQNKILEKTK